MVLILVIVYSGTGTHTSRVYKSAETVRADDAAADGATWISGNGVPWAVSSR